MKKSLYIFIAAFCMLSFCAGLKAQDVRYVPDGYQVVDSLVYVQASKVNDDLEGLDITGSVSVHQSQAISEAFQGHLSRNKDRAISGYRVRIFFDNSQKSRAASESVLDAFVAAHPGCAAYRSYVNPYFKVTVGDFRTRNEAMKFLSSIKSEYPSAFIVKENINYPVVNDEESYVVDTLHIVRKIDYFGL